MVDYIILSVVKGSAFSQLYYIPLVMGLYLLFPILVRVYQKYRIPLTLFVLFISLSFVSLMNSRDISSRDFRWLVFPWLIYAVAGFWFAEYRQKFSNNKQLAVISVMSLMMLTLLKIGGHLQIGVYNYGVILVMIVFITTTMALFINFPVSKYVDRAANYLSKASYDIYLMHFLVIDAVAILMINIVTKWSLLTLPLIYLAILATSVAIYRPIKLLITYLQKLQGHNI
jgi:surface polysaccharide O-acyltransferase-like enzyme